MKIQCNCCNNKPIFELSKPEYGNQVFCTCGKLLAAPKKFMNSWDWQIFDISYGKDFTPVIIIDEKKFIETIHQHFGTINFIFDK